MTLVTTTVIVYLVWYVVSRPTMAYIVGRTIGPPAQADRVGHGICMLLPVAFELVLVLMLLLVPYLLLEQLMLKGDQARRQSLLLPEERDKQGAVSLVNNQERRR